MKCSKPNRNRKSNRGYCFGINYKIIVNKNSKKNFSFLRKSWRKKNLYRYNTQTVDIPHIILYVPIYLFVLKKRGRKNHNKILLFFSSELKPNARAIDYELPSAIKILRTYKKYIELLDGSEVGI